MRTSRPYILVGASIGLVFAGVAAFELMTHPRVAAKLLGRGKNSRFLAREDLIVDRNSEDSFPASDPPSYSPL